MPRALQIVTTLDGGGAEHHLLALVRGLATRDWRCDVIFLKNAGELAEDFRQLGCDVQKIKFEKFADAPGAIDGIRKRIRRGRYDLVHTHLLKANFIGGIAARLAGARLIGSRHNDEAILENKIVAFLHRQTSAWENKHVVLSRHVAGFFTQRARLAPKKIAVVYYGLDPAKFDAAVRRDVRTELGIPENSKLVLMVARFVPQKDHATLLRAVAMLDENVHLLLVGGGPTVDAVGELALRTAIAGRVHFLGRRNDVPSLMKSADVVTLTSNWEGFGLVLLEAYAARVPVVATAVSAIPEIVIDRVTGLLVPPADPAALAQALRDVLHDPELAQRIVCAAHERLTTEFGVDRMVDGIHKIYTEALA